jgi:hypothetical protein
MVALTEWNLISHKAQGELCEDHLCQIVVPLVVWADYRLKKDYAWEPIE